jgi:hypothetical protein
MKTLKSIDIKSALIGFLLCSIFFFGLAATSPVDKWDAKQEWLVAGSNALFGQSNLSERKWAAWWCIIPREAGSRCKPREEPHHLPQTNQVAAFLNQDCSEVVECIVSGTIRWHCSNSSFPNYFEKYCGRR